MRTQSKIHHVLLDIYAPCLTGHVWEDGGRGADRSRGPLGWHYVGIRATDGAQLFGSRIYATRAECERAMARSMRRQTRLRAEERARRKARAAA